MADLPDYAQLELLVAKIQKQLAPNSEVLHNQKLKGRKTNSSRQIDVLVRDRIGQYEIVIVIDCKDYKSPVDVKGVGEFFELMDDVGAQKGVLVCPAGFTKNAKKRAADWQIDLFSPVDTDVHKWQATVSLPAICVFKSAAISIGLSVTGPQPFELPQDFMVSRDALDSDGNALGAPFPVAAERWNNGTFPDDAGNHDKLQIYAEENVFMENGFGVNIPVELYANLHVKEQLFFGSFPITNLSGFKDEIKGGVITNAFEGVLDKDTVLKTWIKLDKAEQAPVQPSFLLVGRVAWSDLP